MTPTITTEVRESFYGETAAPWSVGFEVARRTIEYPDCGYVDHVLKIRSGSLEAEVNLTPQMAKRLREALAEVERHPGNAWNTVTDTRRVGVDVPQASAADCQQGGASLASSCGPAGPAH